MTIVSTMPTAKKVFAALVIASPLTLVACASGEADSDSTAAAGAESAVTSTKATDDSSSESAESQAPEGEPEDSEGESKSRTASREQGTVAPDGPDAQGANAGGQQTIANPFEEGTGAQLEAVPQEPVRDGAPAGEQDAEAISNLVNGIYQQTTLNALVQYVPNNTCNAVLEESDYDASYNTQGVPDMPLSQIPQFQQAQPSVDSIDNLAVAGEHASADVTVTTGGQTDTATYRFLREDGRWKFCSSEV